MNESIVQTVYAVGGVVFLVALFAGFARTAGRVLYYHFNQSTRPKLLTRDLIVYGGLTISFGLISLVRFLPRDERIALTTGNVAWAIATTLPACLAVLTYLYFEVWVIEKGQP